MSIKPGYFPAFFRKFVLILAFLLPTSMLFAGDPDNDTLRAASSHVEKAEAKESKFNAGELILDHIGDSHEWHIAGHVAVPLPVILYSKRGLSIFLSNHLEDGSKGFKFETLKDGSHKMIAFNPNGTEDEETTASIYDLSITKNVFAIFVTMALMLWVFLATAKAYKRSPGKAPKGLQSFIEPLIIFVRDDIAKSAIGEKKYMKYLPFLLTVFFFIWFSNMLGLIPIFPFGANVTGNIAVALTLAFLVFLITTLSGNANYWKHIVAMPGVPVGVLVLLTPIEIIGIFLKPFVLMIRLFANILAGHIIALSFFCLIFIFAEMNAGLGLGVSVLSIAFTVFMGMLELLVAFLQAYVFTLLAAMYFGSATEEHAHAEHH
ncbi:MAG TPA: F0F1 ATP synthase subunit A [Bacteroidia bacterium]|jgi:F-type H+-transporting ATPase subunit a|nr:F0F1 ATP synthase subunit A [Bacteroidia bacterium]